MTAAAHPQTATRRWRNPSTPPRLLPRGHAYFAGALSAATGTFAGTLAAVDGTFEGDLHLSDASGNRIIFYDSSDAVYGQIQGGFDGSQRYLEFLRYEGATLGGGIRLELDEIVLFNEDVRITRSLNVTEDLRVQGNLDHEGSGLGFYGTAPIAKQTVTGSRGGNAALQNLLLALASTGLITNSTT